MRLGGLHKSQPHQRAGGEGERTAAGNSSRPVSREEYWLDLWAFSTSPYGLALSTRQFWRLTFRTFEALKRQWENHRQHSLDLYAGIQTTLHAERFKKRGGGAWEPRDFIGKPKPPKPLVERKGEISEMIRAAAEINKKRGRNG